MTKRKEGTRAEMQAPSTLLIRLRLRLRLRLVILVSKPDQVQLESEVGVLSLVAAWLVLTDLGGGYWSNNNSKTMMVTVNLVK